MQNSFVVDTVFALESSHPQAVADMHALASQMFPTGADGKGRSARSGNYSGSPASKGSEPMDTHS